MTIFEQILAGLQQKFAGVDTATLTRIATKKAEGVTDETKVTSIVEGISFQDVMQNYGDFRAGQAQTSAVSNYEKKHGLKDGKPIENPKPEPPKPNDPPKPQETDIAKMIADGIAAGIKRLPTSWPKWRKMKRRRSAILRFQQWPRSTVFPISC